MKRKSPKRNNWLPLGGLLAALCMLGAVFAPGTRPITLPTMAPSLSVAAQNPRPTTPPPTFTPRPTLTATPAPVRAQVLAVTANLRAGPGTAYARVGGLQQGDFVTVLAVSEDRDWWLVEYRGGTAWLSADPTIAVALQGDLIALPVQIVPTLRPVPTRAATRAPSTRRPTEIPTFEFTGGGSGGSCSPCPRNCTQAKAMGCSASEAAACGLDRDGDGVACYGD